MGQVFLLATLGGTTEEVADILSCEEPDISDAKDVILDVFGFPTMAAVANYAIFRHFIPIETDGSHVRPTNRDMTILKGFAGGLSNGDIGKELKLSKQDVSAVMLRLFKKLIASGRTHSMRRSYELGIFRTEDKSIQAIGRLASERTLGRRNHQANQ